MAFWDEMGASRNAENRTNKRIHIYFHHRGLSMFSEVYKKNVESVLKATWRQYGTVTDTYYYCEFSYGFVTFATHE
jgi:hypothetical protein